MIDSSTRTFKIVAGSLFVLGLAWQQIEATRLGYEVERTRHQARILRGRIGQVQVQLETSLSPAQLAAQAKAMGMIQCDPAALRFLDSPPARATQDTFLGRLFPKSLKVLLST
ncbi:MAG: hypothetical protein HY077_10745 [Elusimicrobia bacterium]|nr:hypothetical protein [Elusimicrobiota bacterium]